MKFKYTILFLAVASLFIVKYANGQDVGVVAKLSPNSGCELTNSETVTVQVFNFGSTISTPFDVSYQINGQTPVVETINLGTFNASSSYTHTFAVDASLLAQGTFNMKFYTSLVSDVNNSNDTIYSTVISDATTIGGNLPLDFNVCEVGNSGTINLSGQNGSVLDWELSTDGGVSWSSLTNTATSQGYNNLTVNSEYRVVVQNGLCSQEYSDTLLVSIDPESIGGNVAGPSSACTPPNMVSLSLNNFQGAILDWEYSDDNGVTWQSAGVSSNPYDINNLGQTTSFRAVVQNGVCSSAYSDTLEVVVVSNLSGGSLSPADTAVCIGMNSGNLTLNSHVGNIDYWEYSTDQVSWSVIANTTTSHSFSNLNSTTYYRVIVSACTTDTSSITEVVVNSLSSVGTIGNDTTICENESLINLTPDVYNADTFTWETSIDGGATWVTESSNLSASFTNLSSDQMIRLLAQNGVCPVVISDTLDVTINMLPAAGGFVGKDSVCAGVNSDTVVPTIINGNVNTWLSSDDGGVSWVDIGVSTDSLEIININTTTTYGLVLSSGVCPLDTFYHEIVVSQLSDYGVIIGDTTICQNTISHSVYLINETANNYNWFSSSSFNSNYSIQGSNTDSLMISDVSAPVFIYCEVTNGVCSSVISDTIVVDIFNTNHGITGDTLVAQYNSVVLTAFGGDTYLWDNNPSLDQLSSAEVNAQINNEEVFFVTITDANNCEYRDSIRINLIDEGFEISTIITANNDGYNDFWIIKKPIEINSVSVTVLNIFGQIVYKSDDYQNDWEGIYEGKLLPNGTYYFLVESESIGVIEGNLNIIGNDK
jgi:gliding motility-associated-like protein